MEVRVQFNYFLPCHDELEDLKLQIPSRQTANQHVVFCNTLHSHITKNTSLRKANTRMLCGCFVTKALEKIKKMDIMIESFLYENGILSILLVDLVLHS